MFKAPACWQERHGICAAHDPHIPTTQQSRKGVSAFVVNDARLAEGDESGDNGVRAKKAHDADGADDGCGSAKRVTAYEEWARGGGMKAGEGLPEAFLTVGMGLHEAVCVAEETCVGESFDGRVGADEGRAERVDVGQPVVSAVFARVIGGGAAEDDDEEGGVDEYCALSVALVKDEDAVEERVQTAGESEVGSGVEGGVEDF